MDEIWNTPEKNYPKKILNSTWRLENLVVVITKMNNRPSSTMCQFLISFNKYIKLHMDSSPNAQ